LPHLVPGRGLFSLTRNGALEMYFGCWDETKYSNVGPKQIAARDQWIAAVERIVGVSFDQKQRRAFPKIPPQKWIPVAEQLQAAALKIGNASS